MIGPLLADDALPCDSPDRYVVTEALPDASVLN